MLTQLIVVFVVIAMNGGPFDCAVHPFNLSIGPWMLWLGESVINVVSGASTLKGMTPDQFSFCPYLPDVGRRPETKAYSAGRQPPQLLPLA
jgi:hypothetical protein